MLLRKRSLTAVIAACILGAGVIACFLVSRYVHTRRVEAIRQSGFELQMAIERWSMDQPECIVGWQYPASISLLQAGGYLSPSIPKNPVTGEPMKELRASDATTSGDFHYIPCQVQYQLSDGSVYVEHYLYTIVLYVSGRHDPNPIFDGRLGSTETTVLENGFDRRVYAPPTPEVQALLDKVVSKHEETYDEALTRLGYK